jgi:hypothetical protein
MGDQQQEYTQQFAMKNGWREGTDQTWQQYLDKKFPGLKEQHAGGKPGGQQGSTR